MDRVARPGVERDVAREERAVTSTNRKLLSLLGILLVGDAVAELLHPSGHVRAWMMRDGPRWWNAALRSTLRHPGALYAATAAELALGVGVLQAAEARA